jgi:hypothetical protein
MKSLLSILLALAFAASAAAEAHSSINARQGYQSARIDAGVARGALTPREAARLDTRQAHVARVEQHYRADGRLGRYERADLQRRLDRNSAANRRQAHDRQRW